MDEDRPKKNIAATPTGEIKERVINKKKKKKCLMMHQRINPCSEPATRSPTCHSRHAFHLPYQRMPAISLKPTTRPGFVVWGARHIKHPTGDSMLQSEPSHIFKQCVKSAAAPIKVN